MKNLYSFLILCVLFMLTGCFGTTKIVTVKETTTVVLTSPKAYTAATPVPAPSFTKEEYEQADWVTRSQFNAKLSATLYQSIGQCNADKASLRSWEVKEKASLEKITKTEK